MMENVFKWSELHHSEVTSNKMYVYFNQDVLKSETLSCLQLYSNPKSFFLWWRVFISFSQSTNYSLYLFSHYRSKITTFIDDNKALLRRMYGDRVQVELVSKELNHFEGIALSFRDWASGTPTCGA